MGFLTATRGEASARTKKSLPCERVTPYSSACGFFALFKVLWVPRIRYAAQIYPTSVFIDYSSPVSN